MKSEESYTVETISVDAVTLKQRQGEGRVTITRTGDGNAARLPIEIFVIGQPILLSVSTGSPQAQAHPSQQR